MQVFFKLSNINAFYSVKVGPSQLGYSRFSRVKIKNDPPPPPPKKTPKHADSGSLHVNLKR